MSQFYSLLLDKTQAERSQMWQTPIIQDALQGRVQKHQYLAFLEQAYHHVKHTVPLLMACGSRIGSQHPWLQKAIAEYIEEEQGHEEWILDDIRAAGGDSQGVKSSRPSLATHSMVAYAYHQIDRANPIGFFGMVHVLEGTSNALATHAAHAIQLSLQLPHSAFSYLRSHGSLDQEHVQFFQILMDQIESPEDQQCIVHCAQDMYGLYGNIFRSLPGHQ